MFVAMVHVHAKPERVEEFKQLSLENASNSLKEPGIVRFDVFQQQDDPNRFVFIEIYKSVDDVAKHKTTDHSYYPTDKPGYLAVMHGEAAAEANDLAQSLAVEFNIPIPPIYEMPPAILVHSGPGILAVSLFIN